VTVVAADAYPNFSICGIPYYVSGDVTDWRQLAHRRAAGRGRPGAARLDTIARSIDANGRKLKVTGPGGAEELLSYDALAIGIGAVPVRPPIAGLATGGGLGPADGGAFAALDG
jgi:NADPH-dependent 2,4-dienoyl-CoA reductase/sulfur reductase-like enzyme